MLDFIYYLSLIAMMTILIHLAMQKISRIKNTDKETPNFSFTTENYELPALIALALVSAFAVLKNINEVPIA